MSGATISKTISKPVSYYYCCYPATKNYSANTQGDRVRGDGQLGLCKKLKIDVLSLTLIVQAGRGAAAGMNSSALLPKVNPIH